MQDLRVAQGVSKPRGAPRIGCLRLRAATASRGGARPRRRSQQETSAAGCRATVPQEDSSCRRTSDGAAASSIARASTGTASSSAVHPGLDGGTISTLLAACDQFGKETEHPVAGAQDDDLNYYFEFDVDFAKSLEGSLECLTEQPPQE
jgi:hypothetical protein